MKLEEQIKALLKVKAKVDLYKKLTASIEQEKAQVDEEHKKLEGEHPGLLSDFCNEVIKFCTSRINDLENTSIRQEPPVKVPQKEADSDVKVQAPVPSPELEEPTDPVKFLLKYKHLDNKKVHFETKDGKVAGTVRGLVTPFIKVQTDHGYVVDVSPKHIRIAE